MKARSLQPRTVAPKRAASLPIRRRVLLRGDGTVLVQRIAYCARRLRTVGADVCAGCAEFAGTTRSDFGEAWISCREPASSAAQRTAKLEPVPAGADHVEVHLCLPRSFACIERGAPTKRIEEFLARVGAPGALLVDEAFRPLELLAHGHGAAPLGSPVHESASIARAAAVLAYEERDQLAIVDADGAAVGLLAARDVLRWLAAGAGYLLPEGPASS